MLAEGISEAWMVIEACRPGRTACSHMDANWSGRAATDRQRSQEWLLGTQTRPCFSYPNILSDADTWAYMLRGQNASVAGLHPWPSRDVRCKGRDLAAALVERCLALPCLPIGLLEFGCGLWSMAQYKFWNFHGPFMPSKGWHQSLVPHC
jgi:hypothetical protein